MKHCTNDALEANGFHFSVREVDGKREVSAGLLGQILSEETLKRRFGSGFASMYFPLPEVLSFFNLSRERPIIDLGIRFSDFDVPLGGTDLDVDPILAVEYRMVQSADEARSYGDGGEWTDMFLYADDLLKLVPLLRTEWGDVLYHHIHVFELVDVLDRVPAMLRDFMANKDVGKS